ncbi:hypothetical protein OKHIF_25010 [Mycobacteroides chelonae]
MAQNAMSGTALRGQPAKDGASVQWDCERAHVMPKMLFTNVIQPVERVLPTGPGGTSSRTVTHGTVHRSV